jgi:hypothetical protein
MADMKIRGDVMLRQVGIRKEVSRGTRLALAPLAPRLWMMLARPYAVLRCAMLAKNCCARSPISAGLRSSLCVAMPHV